MNEVEVLKSRVNALEKALVSILGGHDGDTRDELKKRIEALESKLHVHLETGLGRRIS